MKYTALTLSLFSLVVILQNTSCTHSEKYVKETQVLDSLQAVVNKADSAIQTIDSAKITSYANKIMMDDQFLNMYHIDSMSPEAAAIFRDCNSLRWSFLTLAGKRGPIYRELEKSKKQLSHLEHDMKHNLANADSIHIYIGFETKKANELIQVSFYSVSELSRQLPLYTALTPKADSLITLLKNHKKL